MPVLRKPIAVALIALAGCTELDAESVPSSKALSASTRSNVKHLVIVQMENHSFDNYFGDWCMAKSLTPLGQDKLTCDSGWDCCETAFTDVSSWKAKNQPDCYAPPGVPGGVLQTNDAWNDSHNGYNGANPNVDKMRRLGTSPFRGLQLTGFGMDRFPCSWVSSGSPGSSTPVAIEMSTVPWNGGSDHLTAMFTLARNGALADRYFQPIVGASTSNTIFFTTAGFVMQDNDANPKFAKSCKPGNQAYLGPTIGLRMDQAGVSWTGYFQGYAGVGWSNPPDCPWWNDNKYSPNDNPHTYFPTAATVGANPGDAHAMEYDWYFQHDVTQGALPSVTTIKPLAGNSQHPGGYGYNLTKGERFVERVNATLFGGTIAEGSSCPPPAAGGTCTCANGACSTVYPVSPQADSTLLLVTYDEAGGFYDHVSPPTKLADATLLPRAATDSKLENIWNAIGWAGNPVPVDAGDPECFRCQADPGAAGQQYYGPRVPMIALGPLARRYLGTGYISHVMMEHSSVVKFIEWNWNLTSLGRRDDHVNNIGSLLSDNPAVIGGVVPEGVHGLCEDGAALGNSLGNVGDLQRGIGSTPAKGTPNGVQDGSQYGNGCVDKICGVKDPRDPTGATSIVAGIDPFCCNVRWDGICVAEVTSTCAITCPGN